MGTTASAGILFTVLSISSKSALSSTESRMRVSLLWSPWARSCASVSVRGAAVEFWDEGWVESRERRSSIGRLSSCPPSSPGQYLVKPLEQGRPPAHQSWVSPDQTHSLYAQTWSLCSPLPGR